MSALMLVLAACGSDEDSSSTDGETTNESATTDSGAEATADFGDIKFLSILTGGTQGTYYPLGGTFADLITSETGVKTTAEVSQASAANMTALEAGDGEVAFVQTDIAFYATNGTLMFDGQKIESVSALGALCPEIGRAHV